MIDGERWRCGAQSRELQGIVLLVAVYFVVRLLLAQFSALKLGFIFPSGLLVNGFIGGGAFSMGEWSFRLGHTAYVLGESCSGTTFFAMLFAYVVSRVQMREAAIVWLVAVYPLVVMANGMRVISSMYIDQLLNGSQLPVSQDGVHSVTGVVAFLSVFLLVAAFMQPHEVAVRR